MNVPIHMLAFYEANENVVRNVEVPDHELVGDIDHDMEMIYYYGQNDTIPQQMCSVSIGDVIEYNGKYWLVISFGFKEMSKEEYDTYRNTDRSERIIDAYRGSVRK